MPAIGGACRPACRAGAGELAHARQRTCRIRPHQADLGTERPPSSRSEPRPRRCSTIRRIRSAPTAAPRAARSATQSSARTVGPEWRNRSPSSSVITPAPAGRPGTGSRRPGIGHAVGSSQRRAGGGNAAEYRLTGRKAETGRTPPRTSSAICIGERRRRQAPTKVSAAPLAASSTSRLAGVPPRPTRHAPTARAARGRRSGILAAIRKPPAGSARTRTASPSVLRPLGRPSTALPQAAEPGRRCRRARAAPARPRPPPAPAPRPNRRSPRLAPGGIGSS